MAEHLEQDISSIIPTLVFRSINISRFVLSLNSCGGFVEGWIRVISTIETIRSRRDKPVKNHCLMSSEQFVLYNQGMTPFRGLQISVEKPSPFYIPWGSFWGGELENTKYSETCNYFGTKFCAWKQTDVVFIQIK